MTKILLVLTLLLAFASFAFGQATYGDEVQSRSHVSTRVSPPAATAASFFAMDVDSGCCSNPNDPWPSQVAGISFSTWRSLGSGVSWAQISPCPPTQTSCTGVPPANWICNSFGRCYNFGNASTGAGLDGLVALAQANGQSIMFTATATPAWDADTSHCNGGSSDTCPPLDLYQGDTTWMNFIKDLIAHEGVGKIKYLEIWNEPNRTTAWNGTEGDLITLVKDGHSAAKATDSGIKVISPAVTADPVSANCSGINHWLPDLLAPPLNMGKYADIIGFHGYVSLNNKNNTSSLALDASCVGNVVTTVRNAIKTAGLAGGTPIYDTEGSWLTQYASTISPNQEASFTGIFYLIQASAICTASPCYPLIGFSWYGWDFDSDDARPTGAFWDDAGETDGGSGAFTNAGIAYINLYKWLVNATPVSQCSRAGNTWTCNYTRSGGYQARAVWSDSSSCNLGCSYTYPSWAKYSRSLVNQNDTDNPLSGGTVTIGYTPILLESAPLP
jgi:hypothetical protein